MTHEHPLYCIILAAGDGTRMKSKTPKVLHEIAQKPMIHHVIDCAKQLNPDQMLVVIGQNQAEIKEVISPIQTAIQSPAKGTADAVRIGYEALCAAEKKDVLKGDVLVLYGDTPLVEPGTLKLMRLEMSAASKKPGIVVLGMRPFDPAQYGRLVLAEDETVERIVEFKEATEAEKQIEWCNAGLMLFDGEKLASYLKRIDCNNAKGEYYLTDAIALAKMDGDSCHLVEAAEEDVMGVNSRAELADAEMIFQNRRRDHFMAQGVTLIDPFSVYFAADTIIGADTIIEPNVFFGKGVTVGSHCHIYAFSHFEGATIGNECEIGPFARIRPASHLHDNVKIGNFVETKKSVIEKGAKVSHLSYVGDAFVGEKANIGAGTITCNYDGVNKFQTKIGKGAFIGSNSSLVAPIEIGEGAMIGAGSVITKTVEPFALGVARGRQVNKENWRKS
ncbi:MAG: bifunctional UDP-N-acetylglucosamine diphosphorylase/glucosamine-1-phosphate N-acetyltransferase GlmU [Alphaproteobacteria bacterium]|nr:bifunctional UDP-N-acetylglucosamine diphosphorylase/glucosamine-1-phosphate N-acetyltransferase GlmU [Alphaproteobacteria bacterium]MBP9877846.1 bifunctional UDP-N-acetylglucosamine diphosphorylase/glucosamine-1-phosphate N-acetyltransferase GlmU [Alphaproteobacteria bacterium]